MERGAQRHSRLTDDPWVTPRLDDGGQSPADYLTGRCAAPSLEMGMFTSAARRAPRRSR
jgi:hypothetical protein